MREVEDAYFGGGGNVSPAAKLARDVLDLDHAHPVAVLLAEESHRAERLGLCAASLDRAHRVALEDPPIHESLDVADLIGCQSFPVGEVEAQLLGADVRAGLAHVRT